MEMLEVRTRDRYVAAAPPDDRPPRVDDGHCEREDRYGQSDSNVDLGDASGRDHANRDAEEMGALVAHADPRRVEIEDEAARPRAGQRTRELEVRQRARRLR